MPSPLEGIRVIDWTVHQMGPMAATMLADLGADVIKIEPPVIGELSRRVRGRFAWMKQYGRTEPDFLFETFNRNKRGMALDLTKEEGKEVFYRLVKVSDVLIQNYQPGVVQRLGLDYQSLTKHNPRLIYASASGYGPKGPDSAEPAMDSVVQARAGIMTASGEPGAPPTLIRGVVGDTIGGIILAHAILAALVHRERTGAGQEVATSLLGSLVFLQAYNVGAQGIFGHEMPPTDRTKESNPMRNRYQCADGKWIFLTLNEPDRYWPTLCRALGIEHLEKDPKYESSVKRAENCEELISILDRVFATKPRAEWANIFRQAGELLWSPVNTIAEVVNDPQVLANDYVVNFTHPKLGQIKVPGIPVHFSKTPGSIRSPAPELGQHTEEILLELGYSADDVSRLREKKAI